MRSLQRRKQDVWTTIATRNDETIEGSTTYSKPEKHRFTVSNTTGTPHELPVGIVAEYNRYIVSFDRDFKPVEGMMFYVDVVLVLDAETKELILDENGEPITKPDYVLNHIGDTQKGTIARYGIKKVAGESDE